MRALSALLASAAGGVAVLVFHAQRLPARVASHFGGSGLPDGWMDRSSYVLFSIALLLGTTAIFGGVALLVRRLPAQWINLPNRDYWLAPERGAMTRRHIAAWCYAFGAILNVFLVFVFHLAYRANLSDPVALNTTAMMLGLAVYLAVTLGSVVAMLVRYGR